MIFASLRLLLLIVWIALCCLPAAIAKKLGKPIWRDRVSVWCYRGLLGIAGIRLSVDGQLAQARPLLLVTNHVSYLDIMILGSIAPLRFTPKSEVTSWPAVGAICRMCDAVFVDRRPEKIPELRQALHATLARGDIVCLFPEATTGDGLHLLPFKSGFFSLAEAETEGAPLQIQPAAVVYTRLRRLPIDSTQWPKIAWYGDMHLLPHLWTLLRLGPIDAALMLLPPVTAAEQGDRKRLAAHCRAAIAYAIEAEKGKHPVRVPQKPRKPLRSYLARSKS